MHEITVIGSLNMDLVVRAPRVPLAGETIAGTSCHLIPGGKGANQAVAASRAGASTHMIGCVGQDAFGPALLGSLTEAGVNTSGVQVLPDISTGTAAIIVEENGENRIIIVPGTNALVSTSFIEELWADISHSDMILLQHEIPLQTVHKVVEQAHQNGIKVILNAAPIYAIPLEILKKLDVLIINETEGSTLSGITILDQKTAFDAATYLHGSGVRSVIITLGSEGAVFVNNILRLYQPAFKVKVVDTTAAGDTFVGAYAASILEGKSEPDALLYASAAAALAVTRIGAQISIPDRLETLEFIKKETPLN
jgi:ribokinase